MMCPMIYTSIATTPTGGMYPCCRMKGRSKFYGDPKDYWTSDYIKDLKNTMKAGQWPDDCIRCKKEEEYGIVSKRQREIKSWISIHQDIEKVYDSKGVRKLDLRLSNKCNLQCISCVPSDSSKIFDEVSNNLDAVPLHYVDNFNKVKHLNLTHPYTDQQIDRLFELITSDTRQVYITGGEPSVVQKAIKLIENMKEKGYQDTIELVFNSNFQSFNSKWIELIKEFDGVMMPSIDGIGKVAEYARYPCNWNQVNINLKKFLQAAPHWCTKIFVTPSVLNIFDLKNMFEWRDNEIKPLLSSGQVCDILTENKLINPPYLSLKILPNKAKLKIHNMINDILNEHNTNREETSNLKMLQKYIKQENIESNFKVCIEQLDRLDKVRNTNWRESLDILAEFENI